MARTRGIIPLEDYSSKEEIIYRPIYRLNSGESIGIIAYPTNGSHSLSTDTAELQDFIGAEEWTLVHP